MGALDLVHQWPVDRVAAGVVTGDGTVHGTGDVEAVFALASLTKLATALAVLVAAEEGTVTLDQQVTDRGATLADLLAHSAGIGPDPARLLANPRSRRIYSTAAYDLAASTVAQRADMPFAQYLELAVFEPLRMSTARLEGSPGADGWGSVTDVLRLLEAWHLPSIVHESTLSTATRPWIPALEGVVPGFGRHDPNPWGLGPEIRGSKNPHWTGSQNSPQTYGHFGRQGTMAWIDPRAGIRVVALTDRPFGQWAADAWPLFSDAVLAEFA